MSTSVDVVLENLGEIESDTVGEFAPQPPNRSSDGRAGGTCAYFERTEDVSAKQLAPRVTFSVPPSDSFVRDPRVRRRGA